jgi:hypothetical protein
MHLARIVERDVIRAPISEPQIPSLLAGTFHVGS